MSKLDTFRKSQSWYPRNDTYPGFGLLKSNKNNKITILGSFEEQYGGQNVKDIFWGLTIAI